MQISSKVWSNVFFLIPLFYAVYLNFILYAVLILLVSVFSFAYHFSKEKKYKIPDKIFAYILIIYNIYTIYLSGFKQPYFTLALGLAAFGIYMLFNRNKDDYEWHIASSAITMMCILAI
jgi:hypothetical protein